MKCVDRAVEWSSGPANVRSGWQLANPLNPFPTYTIAWGRGTVGDSVTTTEAGAVPAGHKKTAPPSRERGRHMTSVGGVGFPREGVPWIATVANGSPTGPPPPLRRICSCPTDHLLSRRVPLGESQLARPAFPPKVGVPRSSRLRSNHLPFHHSPMRFSWKEQWHSCSTPGWARGSEGRPVAGRSARRALRESAPRKCPARLV
jgi:hypothetical protein